MWYAKECKKNKFIVQKYYRIGQAPAFHVWAPDNKYLGEKDTALKAFSICETYYNEHKSIMDKKIW